MVVSQCMTERPLNYRPEDENFQDCLSNNFLECQRKCENYKQKFCYFKSEDEKDQQTYAGCMKTSRFWRCCNKPWKNNKGYGLINGKYWPFEWDPQYSGEWRYTANRFGQPTCRHETEKLEGGITQTARDGFWKRNIKQTVCKEPNYWCRRKEKGQVFIWWCVSPNENCNEINQTVNDKNRTILGILIPCLSTGVCLLMIVVILVICRRRKMKVEVKETIDENIYYGEGDVENDYQETIY
eukprot:GFUD01118894.1.p1 GENE.GFUD01118894.1~~GFUD01118894.1.p1  ORF type:complete len:264 (-),score=45.81 GFUD01118894.1:28-747(-)